VGRDRERNVDAGAPVKARTRLSMAVRGKPHTRHARRVDHHQFRASLPSTHKCDSRLSFASPSFLSCLTLLQLPTHSSHFTFPQTHSQPPSLTSFRRTQITRLFFVSCNARGSFPPSTGSMAVPFLPPPTTQSNATHPFPGLVHSRATM